MLPHSGSKCYGRVLQLWSFTTWAWLPGLSRVACCSCCAAKTFQVRPTLLNFCSTCASSDINGLFWRWWFGSQGVPNWGSRILNRTSCTEQYTTAHHYITLKGKTLNLCLLTHCIITEWKLNTRTAKCVSDPQSKHQAVSRAIAHWFSESDRRVLGCDM